MRIWTISFKSLDQKRLNALWRETLLAKKGIEYKLNGLKFAYQNHPQSKIFQDQINPLNFINTYLYYIWIESKNRNYKYDLNKINFNLIDTNIYINVSEKQIQFEYNHLSKKIKKPIENIGSNNLFKIKNIEWKYEKKY